MRVPLTILALLLLGGCATNRVTGDLDHNWYDEESDVEMGEEVMRQVLRHFRKHKVPVDTDEATLTQLRYMVERISKVTEYPEFPWEVHIAEVGVPNAWCAAGGKIMVYRGLFHPEEGLVRTSDELAGVLAHEIAHATCRHVTRQRSTRISAMISLFIPYLALYVIAPYAVTAYQIVSEGGLDLYMPSHSRDAEREADRYGLMYMARAGYDPRVMPQMWRRAAERRKDGLLDVLYASHPGGEDRAGRLEEHMPEAVALFEKAVASR